jgi:hypothetical protein
MFERLGRPPYTARLSSRREVTEEGIMLRGPVIAESAIELKRIQVRNFGA